MSIRLHSKLALYVQHQTNGPWAVLAVEPSSSEVDDPKATKLLEKQRDGWVNNARDTYLGAKFKIAPYPHHLANN